MQGNINAIVFVKKNSVCFVKYVALHNINIKCLPFVNKLDSIYTERNTRDWFCTVCTGQILPFNHFDENEDFYQSIMENWTANAAIPFHVLRDQTKLFVPFELNKDVSL